MSSEPPRSPSAPPSAPEWLAALRRREPGAFERLVQEFAGPLYRRVLLPRLGAASLAEDALAETFRKAFERLGQFEDRGKGPWGWLATIAANHARDVHRESERRGRALSSFADLLAPLEEGLDAELESGLDEQRVRARVAQVLGALRERYRRAIQLRFLEERSREECAALLELKIGTFDVLLLRALRAFRKAWDGAPSRAG